MRIVRAAEDDLEEMEVRNVQEVPRGTRYFQGGIEFVDGLDDADEIKRRVLVGTEKI